ncbi:MAG: KpsF/GutQ family sugar-phosphate isomerase [Deltaproteobacteria bacterium]|nr:KpsF/GutQ family sugar-phosphate isomerase [Deltaproteobacteria bacterium]
MSVERGRRVLKIEADAIRSLRDKIDENFVRAVEIIYHCRGKVVVMGVGKSGIVARKIAATLASTGTPAFFLHPVDGLHGDLGMLVKEDIVMILSNSGETDEVSRVLPLLQRYGTRLIAITGNINSNLAKAGDVVLDVCVKEEACPFGLVPTASTTAAMALGDALAIALLDRRGFKENDFATLHPGGHLGKKWLKVGELMHTGEAFPMVGEDTLMREAIFEITSKRLGVTGVVDAGGKLVGVITDGDLRRALEKYGDLLNRKASDIMTRDPKWIDEDSLAAKAVQKMEEYSITSLFVFKGEGDRTPIGIIHLHDLLKAGVV